MSLEQTRAELLARFDDITTPSDVIDLQRALAAEIRSAEADRNEDNDWHRHLLRLMGDAIAWKSLERHSIRELARGRRRPPSLTSQGQDFDYVLDVATEVADGNLIPIVADLTHLISVGDIIAVGPSAISILECKNRKPPAGPPRGRHRRQEIRALQAADYLTDGIVTSSDGMKYLSVEVAEPQPEIAALQQCIEAAQRSPVGAALLDLGERDLILALWPGGLDPNEVLQEVSVDPANWAHPQLSFISNAVENPGPFRFNPYATALPMPFRLALAEGELIVGRFVDLGFLETRQSADGGPDIEIYRKEGNLHLRTNLLGHDLEFSDRFIEQVMWNFTSVHAMGATLPRILSEFARLGPDPTDEAREEAASPTVTSLHGFIYSDVEENGGNVFVTRVGHLTSRGIDLSLEEFEASLGGGDGGLNHPEGST
ncbi:hypothetical protein [Actinomadura oligospora]|uniref:hypothetical protein n=1 Tax=Actinomadura oligospora TaxID=111804 RepID=UPI0012F9609F|nr:hypothetical protein [Actinomadura oligospora]